MMSDVGLMLAGVTLDMFGQEKRTTVISVVSALIAYVIFLNDGNKVVWTIFIYLELRKSKKSFMVAPQGVTVQSITTQGKQKLWIGREKYEYFSGKKLCFLDDVVSTGGTIDAVMELAPKIGIEISVIACVLTEGTARTDYKGIPLVCLDHIPLPGKLHVAENNQ